MKRLHNEVQIESCDNGILIRVGCKCIVVKESEIQEAFLDLTDLYLGVKSIEDLAPKWGIELRNRIEECGMQEATLTTRC